MTKVCLLMTMRSYGVRPRHPPSVCRRSWCVAHRVRPGPSGCGMAEPWPFLSSANATTPIPPPPPNVNLAAHAGTVQLRGRRLALVIGVCRYEGPSLVDLPVCQRDAERMAELLAGFGYTVDVLLNATRAQIEEGTCACMRRELCSPPSRFLTKCAPSAAAEVNRRCVPCCHVNLC
jgi:hypothetical protein